MFSKQKKTQIQIIGTLFYYTLFCLLVDWLEPCISTGPELPCSTCLLLYSMSEKIALFSYFSFGAACRALVVLFLI